MDIIEQIKLKFGIQLSEDVLESWIETHEAEYAELLTEIKMEVDEEFAYKDKQQQMLKHELETADNLLQKDKDRIEKEIADISKEKKDVYADKTFVRSREELLTESEIRAQEATDLRYMANLESSGNTLKYMMLAGSIATLAIIFLNR